MADDDRRTLAEGAARQLANATKTRAQWGGITPRWLVQFLPWTPVEAGIYRLNRVKETRGAPPPPSTSNAVRRATATPTCRRPSSITRRTRASTSLNAVTTVLDVQTRVSDLYSHPFDQIQEQLRLLIEKVKERQESELINNKDYGLLDQHGQVHADQDAQGPADAGRSRRADRQGLEGAVVLPRPPARHRRVRPRVHAPRRAASDRQRCSARRSSPGAGCRSCRPTRCASTGNGKTKILLLRTGEKKQGVVGLFQPGVPGEVAPSLSVRFMGIDRRADRFLPHLALLLAGGLTDDALGVLEDVDVGRYHDYPAPSDPAAAAASAAQGAPRVLRLARAS